MISPVILMLVLTCGVFVSLLFGKIATLIDANQELDDGSDLSHQASMNWEHLAGWLKPETASLEYSTSDDLLWFIQISDLHISIFQDPERITQLRHFVNVSLPAISPELVIASGDLTNAIISNTKGSRQYQEEWQIYKDVLVSGNVFNSSFWLDLRGNHDVFDVPGFDSGRNLFRRFGVQGGAHPRSYLYTVARGRRRYAFVALDATLDPGPRRPYNFFGAVRPRELAALREYARRSRRADHVIWFGHYPTSTLVSSDAVRRLMRGSLAYLCGHLHTLAGLVPHMYARQRSGTLELELADWKHSRRYRVLAIDHGLLSFVDVDANDQWPVVMVTNPKQVQLAMPRNEPLWAMREFPHIRVVAFSVHNISTVQVRLDSDEPWLACVGAGGPLFTCDWRPARYTRGLHTAEVLVEDAAGLSRRVMHTFSLDGTTVEFPFAARFVLMLNASALFQFAFAVALLVCVVPPAVLRILHSRVLAGSGEVLRPDWAPARAWLRRVWLFGCVDRLYWPYVGMLLYLPFGPWVAGEVIAGHFGVVFAWGSFVAGAFLPAQVQYVYGAVQLLLFHLPLMLATACLVDYEFDRVYHPERCSRLLLYSGHSLLLLAVGLQSMHVWIFYMSFGLMTTILGPFHTWTLLMGLYMWYSASTLPKTTLRAAAVVWRTERDAHRATD